MVSHRSGETEDSFIADLVCLPWYLQSSHAHNTHRHTPSFNALFLPSLTGRWLDLAPARSRQVPLAALSAWPSTTRFCGRSHAQHALTRTALRRSSVRTPSTRAERSTARGLCWPRPCRVVDVCKPVNSYWSCSVNRCVRCQVVCQFYLQKLIKVSFSKFSLGSSENTIRQLSEIIEETNHTATVHLLPREFEKG